MTLCREGEWRRHGSRWDDVVQIVVVMLMLDVIILFGDVDVHIKHSAYDGAKTRSRAPYLNRLLEPSELLIVDDDFV